MVVVRDEDCDPRLAAGAAAFEPDDAVEPFCRDVAFLAAAVVVTFFPEAAGAPFACLAALCVARDRGVGLAGSAAGCVGAGSAPTKDS